MHLHPSAQPSSTRNVSLRPRWFAPIVLWSLLAHLLIVVTATAVYWNRYTPELDESVMWTTASFVAIPMLAMLWSATHVPERGTAGEAVMRWSFHLLLLLVMVPVEGIFTYWVNTEAVEARGLDGLDYVPGGATLGMLAIGGLGWAVGWMLGLCVTFIEAMPSRIPVWMRLMSLPLVLVSTVVLAIGGTLGVDTGDARRLAAIYKALMGDGRVTSEAWLLTARISFGALLVGVGFLFVVGKRLAQAGSPDNRS